MGFISDALFDLSCDISDAMINASTPVRKSSKREPDNNFWENKLVTDWEMQALGWTKEMKDAFVNRQVRKSRPYISTKFKENDTAGTGAEGEKNMNGNSVRDLIENGDYEHVGSSVYMNDDIEHYAKQIATASRRSIKKDDIILIAKDDEEVREMTGLVFTETQLYIFENGSIEYVIEYSTIKDVDFDDDYVQITVDEGKEVSFNCGDGAWDDETYAEATYNLLMDIKELVEGN